MDGDHGSWWILGVVMVLVLQIVAGLISALLSISRLTLTGQCLFRGVTPPLAERGRELARVLSACGELFLIEEVFYWLRAAVLLVPLS